MMVWGIGVDLVENKRLENWVSHPRLLAKYFTDMEIRDVRESSHPTASLAARFAAKEAFAKALGTGFRGFHLKDIQTVRDPLGKPRLELLGVAQQKLTENKILRIHLSLTHEKEYAVAFVVLEA